MTLQAGERKIATGWAWRRFVATCVTMTCLAGAVQAFDLQLDLQGGTDGLDADLRGASLLAGLADEDAPVGSDVIAAAKADYQRLVGVLYDRGYFAPVVSIRLDGREAAGLSNFGGGPAVGRAVIQIETGQPFRFGSTSIAPLPQGTQPPSGFQAGAPASLQVMRDAVSGGISSWRAEGHAKAQTDGQQITARHDQTVLDATIRLNPGPKLRFGQLQVLGETTIKPERVRQIAGLPTGDVFSPEEVQRATTRLRRTGAFSSVAASEADTIGPNDTLDIDVQLQDAVPRRFGFGAEVSTEEGLELSAFWLHRNLLGGGERLRLDIEAGGIGGDTGGEDLEAGFRFVRPGFPSYRTDLFIDGRISSLDEPNFSADTVSLQAGLIHTASEQREYTYAIGYRGADTEDAFGSRSYRILTAPLTHTRDYRDNSLNATSGYYAQFGLTPFLALSGTDDGARVFVDGRIYRSAGENDAVTFALRGQLGSLFGPALSLAPADYLFFSGGGGTVRGQDFQSLGVEQPNGLISGGRSFLGASAEVRVKTGERLSVVGFWDAGYIGEEEFPDGTSGDWHSGAGAGIRYDTGVGPIRFDVGVPVSGPGSNNGFEIYIGIGQAF